MTLKVSEIYKEIEIEKIELMAEEWLLDPILDTEYVSNMFRMRLRGYIWGETGKSTIIKYPMDWWQAFKERWCSPWFLNRFPVKYKIHTINTTTLYPTFKISMPKERHTLHLAISEDLSYRAWND